MGISSQRTEVNGSQGANFTAGGREHFANRPREITPLCGKPKTREQNRCASGSVSRRLGFGENREVN